MKVFAIGSIVKPITDEQRMQIMPSEVPQTLQKYLDGKIEQFWFMENKPGVIFLMDVATVEEAKAITDTLPLVTEGFAQYEFYPVGPLKPLGLLLQGR